MQKRKAQYISLKIKAVAGSIGLIIFMATVLNLVYINHQKTVLRKKLEILGSTLARNLAYNARFGVLSSNKEVLRELSQGVLLESDVIYVAILDNDGQFLVRQTAQRHNTKVDLKTAIWGHFDPWAVKPVEYHKYFNEEICQISEPVESASRENMPESALIPIPEAEPEVIGNVIVGLSLRSLQENLTQIRLLTVKYTLFAAALTFILTFLFVSYLTGPIKKLTLATQQVAKGDFSVRIEGHTSDEVGILTASFNRMVQEIKEGQEKIENSKRELERLNNEMEELLHIVSHDLRSPLINIQGFTERLEPLFKTTVESLNHIASQSPDAQLKERIIEIRGRLEEGFPLSIKFITKGVEKMDMLLSRLLAISRVGRKADPLQLNDLNEILNDILLVCDYQLKTKGITVNIQGPLPKARCRRNEINQVFSNLISNAINYMRLDSAKQIKVGYVEGADDYQFYVHDTGIGIAAEDLEKIFRMFSRLQEVDSPGEGIGLAYARKIIRSHYGRMWVESIKGQGSTFYFTLPKYEKGA